MRPAVSLILLTMLVGVGQGLMVALFLAEALAETIWSVQPGSFYSIGGLVVLGFLLAGLVASFFHLGRPERFWRAAMKWRTSWLSREVVVLCALIVVVVVYTVLHTMAGETPSTDGSLAWGLVAAVIAIVLFVCTGMIYACIRFFQQWATPLTVINFALTGLACGFTLATALAGGSNGSKLVLELSGCAFVITVAALFFRVIQMLRNRALVPKATLQSAIGIRSQKVSQKHVGFMGGSFNTREFFHGQSRNVVELARWLLLLLGFIVPAILLWFAWGGELALGNVVYGAATLAVVAFVVQFIGLMIERWFFFADASHAQNLYYESVD